MAKEKKEEQEIIINEAHVYEIREYLELLDLIRDIDVESEGRKQVSKKRTVLTQPGLRYAQVEALITTLLEDDTFRAIGVRERSRLTQRSLDEIRGMPKNRTVILSTGSQGEAMSALYRMAFSEHKQIQVDSGDRVIISASAIPGNELTISRVIDELFANIAHYAYEGGIGDATVRFDFDEAARTASITFIDSGIPFDPLKKADPDVTLSVEEREIGGLGIFMVKKTMNALEYRHENGMNILTMRKQIG